jgi:hypothetical protein
VSTVTRQISPLRVPVLALTDRAREPLEMQGATTSHLVADGSESALDQARAAAGDRPVRGRRPSGGGVTHVRHREG